MFGRNHFTFHLCAIVLKIFDDVSINVVEEPEDSTSANMIQQPAMITPYSQPKFFNAAQCL